VSLRYNCARDFLFSDLLVDSMRSVEYDRPGGSLQRYSVDDGVKDVYSSNNSDSDKKLEQTLPSREEAKLVSSSITCTGPCSQCCVGVFITMIMCRGVSSP